MGVGGSSVLTLLGLLSRAHFLVVLSVPYRRAHLPSVPPAVTVPPLPRVRVRPFHRGFGSFLFRFGGTKGVTREGNKERKDGTYGCRILRTCFSF